jgi:cell division protein FtsQ
VSATSVWHPSRGVPDVGPGVVVRPRAAERRARRWIGAAFGVAVFLAAGWWVTNSRVFDARHISVTGNVHLSSPEVLALTDLSSGTNVLWMSTGQVEGSLERHPWVLSADVSRTLPSGVVISLQERSPVALISAGRPLLVAGDGMILGRAGPSARLPLIEVAGDHAVGSRIQGSAPALVVARAFPPDLRERVHRITVRPGETVLLSLRGGTRVLFGEATEAGAKANALRAVLSWAARNAITPVHIDVRVPAVPALLPNA